MSEPEVPPIAPEVVAEGGLDPDTLAALTMQRRWLAALLADPRHVLLQYDPAVAVVLTSQGEQIALFTHDDSARLAKRLDVLLSGAEAGAAQAVVFGGGPDVTGVLEEKRTLGNRAAFARVSSTGQFQQITGATGSALKAAAERAATSAPLGEVAIGQALSRAQPLRRDAAYFGVAVARGTPVVTTAIAALCIVLFALGFYWSGNQEMAANWRMGANHGQLVRAGEWWRVLASAFLHGSLMHVFVNMLALMSLGRMLERVLGVPRYLALYGLSALGGGLASAMLTPSGSVGASGAIWGLMGAAIALTFFPRGLLPEIAREQMKKRAWSTLGINVLISFAPGIDRYAHFGGGLVGMALVASGAITAGVAPLWAPPPKSRGSAPWALLAGLLGVAMLSSVAAALVHGKPWELRGPLQYQRVQVGDTGLSLELPGLTLVSSAPQGNGSSHVYGEAPADPVVVEVFVFTLARAPTDEGREGLLNQTREALARPPEGFEPSAAPASRELGGRRFSRARYRYSANPSVTMEVWYTVIDDREVRVDLLSLPARNERWQGFEERVLKSLEFAAPR